MLLPFSLHILSYYKLKGFSVIKNRKQKEGIDSIMFNLLVVLLLAFGVFTSIEEKDASIINNEEDVVVVEKDSKISDRFKEKVGKFVKDVESKEDKDVTHSVSEKKNIKERVQEITQQKNPNKLGDSSVVTFDYQDIGGNIYEMDVNFVLREWEVMDKESKDGTQWIKGHFVLAATVDGSDKHEGNLAFPTGVQPFYPAHLNEEFVTDRYRIHSMTGPKFDTYLDIISPDDVRTGSFELLVPSGDITGSIIMINTGASQTWYEL